MYYPPPPCISYALGLLFPDPEIDYPMLIIQYGFAWEDEQTYLDIDKNTAVIC